MPINVLPLLQSNQNQLAALQQAGQQQAGLLNAMNNQTPQLGGLTSDRTLQLSQPNTGNPIDQLGQLGALFQSQNNDAEKKKRQQDDLNFQREQFNFNKQKAIADMRTKAEDRNIRLQKEKANEAKKTATNASIKARFSRISPATLKKYAPTAIGADGKADKTLTVGEMASVLEQMKTDRTSLAADNRRIALQSRLNAVNNKSSDNKARRAFDSIARLNPTVVLTENLLTERDKNPVAALSELQKVITGSKSAERTINTKPFKVSPALLEQRYRNGYDGYTKDKLSYVNPELSGNPRLLKDLNNVIMHDTQAEISKSSDDKGTMANFIDKAISKNVVDTSHGLVMKLPYEKGWVNLVGQDGKAHVINVSTLDVNSNPEIEARARLVAQWLHDYKQSIGVVTAALTNMARAKDGGLVDDLNWADQASVTPFALSQEYFRPLVQGGKAVADALSKHQADKLEPALNNLVNAQYR